MRIRKIPSVYSEEQLAAYLERIGWKGSRPEPTLACLLVSIYMAIGVPTYLMSLGCRERLQRRHVVSIPFTNAFLVYEEEAPGVDA